MREIKKGTEIQGRYVISDSLGTGGFAVVWRATDKQLNRDVAIKRLVHLEKDQKDRLLEEARRTAKLDGHQNIVRVHDDYILLCGRHPSTTHPPYRVCLN
jgi:eukaryotic-like serine/threonine-protein kinase